LRGSSACRTGQAMARAAGGVNCEPGHTRIVSLRVDLIYRKTRPTTWPCRTGHRAATPRPGRSSGGPWGPISARAVERLGLGVAAHRTRLDEIVAGAGDHPPSAPPHHQGLGVTGSGPGLASPHVSALGGNRPSNGRNTGKIEWCGYGNARPDPASLHAPNHRCPGCLSPSLTAAGKCRIFAVC
jgi:hypothetical protein